MVDFFMISTRSKKRGYVEIYPKFIVKKSKDLMIRGGDFYAVWLEDEKRWSTEEDDAFALIDKELDKYREENQSKIGADVVTVAHMWDSDSGMVDKWHKYCQKQLSDYYHSLDEKLIFSNTDIKKTDYASKRLPYPLEDIPTPAYDELMDVLYSKEERTKIEWAIGAVVSGDSKKIQKFLVFYGSAGTGKSTVLNIIQDLFDGYFSVFDAKSLGNSNAVFALEAFKKNPLVAIQHDGDLSHIEDNTRLNSLVSHEIMVVNEKFKATYENRFKAFLFMGTNRPVKITDAKSGLLRRLIDVTPTGNKVPASDYNRLVSQIKFELGGIANHCLQVYLDNKRLYDDYIPLNMLDESNDFYNFMLDNYLTFSNDNYTTLRQAWTLYKDYTADANVPYPLSMRLFKAELKNYFMEYEERGKLEDGTPVASLYTGFKRSIFDEQKGRKKKDETQYRLLLKEQPSIFDEYCKDCLAQYATKDETPKGPWSEVKTTLSKIDTSKLHYVKVPKEHIVIDFDLKDETGKKSFKLNSEAAALWPPTYAEVSKGGEGIHLHYIYNGDVSKLSRVYSEGIEIKIFTGKSSLRRRLTKCNELPIATISTGLPLKEEKPVVNFETLKSEQSLRKLIVRNMAKEIHPGTKPSMDFIKKILDDAYDSGLSYDVSDMRPDILSFAMQSTHQADYCMALVPKLKYKSKNNEEASYENVVVDGPITMYDVEVFPNLFINCYADRDTLTEILGKYTGYPGMSFQEAFKEMLKKHNDDKKAAKKEMSKAINAAWGEMKDAVVAMINPSGEELNALMGFRLVDFNGRHYDRHIIYARMQDYSLKQLYELSKRIISSKKKDEQKSAFFSNAYNLGWTDIYDYSAKKQSLKKWEIEQRIHHQELGLSWDEDVPEDKWELVADYCKNDVLATFVTYENTQADFTARKLLADLAGGTVNDTTNSLTTRIIFGNEKHPQKEFNYRNLAEPVKHIDSTMRKYLTKWFPEMMDYWEKNTDSILPYFKGYEFDGYTSTYRGEKIGEGGKVYAEPGIYVDVPVFDVTSQHPHSALAEFIFGIYTVALYDIVYGRVNIKHEAWSIVDTMLDGKLKPYIEEVKRGDLDVGDLAYALKTAINSVYGLTAASFNNPFKDPRNVDNIVAKRGALFMTDLKYEVQKRGFTVAHIKTDSIKVPGATEELKEFIYEFGKRYGYSFEVEDEYDRICLVNDAVYVAKHKDGTWTATGAQFQVPYVFKTLFSKEPLEFDDFCETKSVKEGDIYLDMNEGLPDVTEEEKQLKKLEDKYKKGELSDTTFEKESAPLVEAIAKGHNYVFVGRVGQFCPIKEGCNGGVMYRYNDGKYYAVTGTKGYRWLESEVVKGLGKEDCIDETYYKTLADKAIDTINKFGDFYHFVDDAPYDCNLWNKQAEDEDLPFPLD